MCRAAVSAAEAVMGTFAWAAPEVLLGGRVESSADIFSFGVLLWEIATGEKPKRGALRDPKCVLIPPDIPVLRPQAPNSECC